MWLFVFTEHFNKPPDQISEEQLRDYFLYVKNVKKWSRTASTIAICGIKFFHEKTLSRQWTTLKLVRPHRENRLPIILFTDEIRRALKCVRFERYRVCLLTIYTCGLRVLEGCNLKISNIDSSRMVVHIEGGKSNKDRYVPLPQRTLEELRQHWKTHRNPVWLFPAAGRGTHSALNSHVDQFDAISARRESKMIATRFRGKISRLFWQPRMGLFPEIHLGVNTSEPSLRRQSNARRFQSIAVSSSSAWQ
ncbi:MAG: tyrosine-type recombinase/integrase [bacterium]